MLCFFIFLHTHKKIKMISKVFLKMINVYPNARQKKIWNKNILSMSFTCNQTGCKLNNTVLFYLKILYRYIIDIMHYQIRISGIDWHLCGFRIKTLVFIVETGGFGFFFSCLKKTEVCIYYIITSHFIILSLAYWCKEQICSVYLKFKISHVISCVFFNYITR